MKNPSVSTTLPIYQRFLVTAGTVPGREHLRLFKNNQDGIGISADEEVVAAVVADGCSEGASSEVGARLAAQWLAAWAPLYARATDLEPRRLAPALARGLVRHFAPFVRGLSANPGIDAAVVQEFCLFTFLMVVMTERKTAIFGIGDGVFSVDGEVTVLDAGEENAPPYVGYRLLPRLEDVFAEPTIHFEGATSDVSDHVLIATDGASGLDVAALASNPRYDRNRSLLHKRLRVLGDALHDDTSCVLIRRRACAA